MGTKELKAFCAMDEATLELLKMAMNELKLSARAYDRILKVARTIADLSESERLTWSTSPKPSSIVRWTGSCGRDAVAEEEIAQRLVLQRNTSKREDHVHGQLSCASARGSDVPF